MTLNILQKKKKKKKKKNMLRERKKNEIKEESYLNYTSIIKYAFYFLTFFIFHQINLLNIHEKTFCLVFFF